MAPEKKTIEMPASDWIAHRFRRSAATYAAAATVQRMMAEQVTELISQLAPTAHFGRIFEIGYRIPDLESVESDHSADVTALDGIHLGLGQAVEYHEFLDFLLLDNIVPLAEAYVHSGLQFASCHPSYGDTSHIRGVFQ